MKTSIALLLLIFAGCATPEPPPFSLVTLADSGPRVIVRDGLDSLKPGQRVLYYAGGQMLVGTVESVRGSGVYRLTGSGFTILSASNFVGRVMD